MRPHRTDRTPGRRRGVTRPRLSRALLVLLLTALGCGLAALAAPVASAHSEVLDTSPGSDSRWTTPPRSVTVTLTEPVLTSVGDIEVTDDHGATVPTGPLAAIGDGRTVGVGLPAGLAAGSYRVSIALVSSDDHHLVSWDLTFVVGTGPLGGADGAGGTDPALGTAVRAVRWVSYAGLVLIGGLAFVGWCWPGGRGRPGVLRSVRAGCVALGAAAVGELLLQGPYRTGGTLGSAFSGELLGASLGAPDGRLLVVRLLAAAVLAVAARHVLGPAGAPRRGHWENTAIIGVLLVVVSFAGTGHAVSDDWAALSMAADAVHLVAMTLWLSGLVHVALHVLPSRPPPAELRLVARRFSRVTAWSVAALVASGAYLGWRLVGSAAALTSGYGLALLGKTAVVVALLGVGWATRQILLGPGPADGDAAATGTLRIQDARTTMAVEAMLAALVLVATTLLTTTALT